MKCASTLQSNERTRTFWVGERDYIEDKGDLATYYKCIRQIDCANEAGSGTRQLLL
jgi:hypothetical protein